MEKGKPIDLEKTVRLYALQYGLFPNNVEAKDNLDKYIQLIISPENPEKRKHLTNIYNFEKKEPLETKVNELLEVFDLIKVFKDEKGKFIREDLMRSYIQKADPKLVPIFEVIFQKAYGKKYGTTKSKGIGFGGQGGGGR